MQVSDSNQRQRRRAPFTKSRLEIKLAPSVTKKPCFQTSEFHKSNSYWRSFVQWLIEYPHWNKITQRILNKILYHKYVTIKVKLLEKCMIDCSGCTQCMVWFHASPAWSIHPGQAKCNDPKGIASVQVATKDPNDPLSTAACTEWRMLAAAASGYPVKLQSTKQNLDAQSLLKIDSNRDFTSPKKQFQRKNTVLWNSPKPFEIFHGSCSPLEIRTRPKCDRSWNFVRFSSLSNCWHIKTMFYRGFHSTIHNCFRQEGTST